MHYAGQKESQRITDASTKHFNSILYNKNILHFFYFKVNSQSPHIFPLKLGKFCFCAALHHECSDLLFPVDSGLSLAFQNLEVYL